MGILLDEILRPKQLEQPQVQSQVQPQPQVQSMPKQGDFFSQIGQKIKEIPQKLYDVGQKVLEFAYPQKQLEQEPPSFIPKPLTIPFKISQLGTKLVKGQLSNLLERATVGTPEQKQWFSDIQNIYKKTPQGLVRQEDVIKRLSESPEALNIGFILSTPFTKKPVIPPSVEDTAVQKVIDALKEAKPIRLKQEKLYTQTRGQRLATALEIGKKITGEKGFYAEKGALKGEMPKVQYESIRGKLGQDDIDQLFIKIKDSPLLNEWDKFPAREGLAKIFGEAGGNVPTKNELKLLNRVFGSDFVKTVSDKRGFWEKAKEAGYEIFNVPRALLASFDLSAPLRQGAFLISKPKQFISSFKNMFKYFSSEKAFQELQENIYRRPTYDLMAENKLALTDIGSNLAEREEAFMSNLAEKIPIIGRGVRASERGYVGFLNKLRADVFDDLLNKAEMQGLDPKNNPQLLKSLADFINTATGRGSLGQLERAALPLNSFFFSPRLMFSRLKLMYPGYYITQEPFVRKEALKSLFTFAGTGLTILGLSKLAGAEVGIDPRSADFGKIKFGNTRYDIWAGFQQYVKLAAQLISGKIVSSTTGQEYTLGEGYKPLTRYDIILRQIESKEAPIFSFVTSLLRGKNPIGEEFDLGSEVAQRFIPMVIQDTYDLYNERGLEGIAMSVPAWFGVGMMTYGDQGTYTGSILKLGTRLVPQKSLPRKPRPRVESIINKKSQK